MRPPLTGTALPLSEEAYLELGETTERAELFDGNLYLSARGRPRHQFVVGRLMDALQAGAAAAGLSVVGAVNLRLGPQRIANPDLILARMIDFDAQVVPAASVVLVAEVAGPADVVNRMLKHRLYAAAGIPWFLLVAEETGVLHLHELVRDAYALRPPDDVLQLTEPVTATIIGADLLPPG